MPPNYGYLASISPKVRVTDSLPGKLLTDPELLLIPRIEWVDHEDGILSLSEYEYWIIRSAAWIILIAGGCGFISLF